MCFVKIPAISTTVTDPGCVLSTYVIAPDFRIAFFEKNAFLIMHLFFVFFLFDFMKLSKCLV